MDDLIVCLFFVIIFSTYPLYPLLEKVEQNISFYYQNLLNFFIFFALLFPKVEKLNYFFWFILIVL